MSVKNKPKQPQKRLLCQYCKDPIDNDNYYLCDCGYQMCWDCYDDFQDEKDPYCPKCDAELISDSEDESTTTKPKTEPTLQKSTSVQNSAAANKTSPQGANKATNAGTVAASSSAATTTSTSSISANSFNYNDLAKVRVIKKNLVYVIGLAPEIANEDMLLKKEYFSQYGKITKIVVNTNNAYNPKGPNGPSFSAYITYSSEREASMAILATEEYQINERIIRASYGTTKYCSYFLKQQECPNLPDCLYLHSFGKDKEFFQKDDSTSNKNIFIDQQKMAIKNIQKYIPDLIKIKNTVVTYNSVLPTPQSVIEKLIELDVLDIKQKPVETQTNEQKGDKKKKEDNTPLIDQWSIDFSIPTPPPKKEESKKMDSPQSPPRKPSQSITEKDLNNVSIQSNNTTPTAAISTTTIPTSATPPPPQITKQTNSQPDVQPQTTPTINKNKTESEKVSANKEKINGQVVSSEEKPFSKEEFLMKAINGTLPSPKTSRSASISQQNETTSINANQGTSTANTASNGKPQAQSSTQNSTNNSNITSTSNIPKTTNLAVTSEQPKKVEVSPSKKEQVQKQEDPKKEEQVENKKATTTTVPAAVNNSQTQSTPAPASVTNSVNVASTVTATVNAPSAPSTSTNTTTTTSSSSSTVTTPQTVTADHSRTSSNNQKTTSNTTSSTTSTTATTTVNGPTKQQNGNSQNGNHYEKKETTKKEQSETKYQKHQYVPINQATKQAQQPVENTKEKEVSQKEEKPQSSSSQANTTNTQQATVQISKEDNKAQKPIATPQVQNSGKPQQTGNNSQTAQQTQTPQTTINTVNKVNDENASSSQLNQQNTKSGAQQQQQQQQAVHQNHHLQQLQSTQSCDSNADIPAHPLLSHHHHAISEPVAPKYILQKVEKLEKTLSSDNQIMKKLINGTTQKSSSSRFDFAKNSDACDQPLEELDVINHIFNGQYIVLTKSQSCKSSMYDRADQ